MNRIAKAVANIRPKVEALGAEEFARLDESMNIEADEHFAYQQAQAFAHASGKLTADEAMIAYVALGEIQNTKNGGWTEGTDLATKVAVTLLIGELVKDRLDTAVEA